MDLYSFDSKTSSHFKPRCSLKRLAPPANSIIAAVGIVFEIVSYFIFLAFTFADERSKCYTNEGEWLSGSVGIHHVIDRKSLLKEVFLLSIIVVQMACYSFSIKENSPILLLWSFLLSGLLVILLLWKPVHKESVIIIPAFGVQLETHYSSRTIIRRFIPAGEIVKPVLVECVTPVTCYWSLSLLVCGKEELISVFQDLRPPMKMLLPIRKALLASIGEESHFTSREDGTPLLWERIKI